MQTRLSVILPQYNPNLIRALLGLRFEQRNLPELKAGEVLIETAFAPCNPSDIAFLRGGYNIVKPLAAVPGFEASGTIIGAASDVLDLRGKRVSCFTQADQDGTWASHFIARAVDCILLKEEMDLKQAACLSINPLTALGMFESVTAKKCPSFIVNAAGGQVPVFMAALAEKEDIPLIHIVRKQDHAEQMIEAGKKYVLNSNSDGFKDELKELCDKLKPSLAFDAVAGEQSSVILEAMSAGAELVVYGALSGADLENVDAMDIIFKGKSIRGFNLNDWIVSMDEKIFKEKTDHVQDLILDGTWQTNIQEIYPLTEVVNGIRAYIKSMSSGKVLFKP